MHMHTSVSPMHIPITVNILCKGTIDGLIYVFLAMSFIYLHELLTISQRNINTIYLEVKLNLLYTYLLYVPPIDIFLYIAHTHHIYIHAEQYTYSYTHPILFKGRVVPSNRYSNVATAINIQQQLLVSPTSAHRRRQRSPDRQLLSFSGTDQRYRRHKRNRRYNSQYQSQRLPLYCFTRLMPSARPHTPCFMALYFI